MKNQPLSLTLSVIGGAVIALNSLPLKATDASQTIIDSFDTETAAEFWTATWNTTPVLTWDADDASGSSTSGSLKVSADYFTPEDDGWEQMVVTRNFDVPVVGSEYESVSIDVKVDPSSVPTGGGQFGYFEFKRPDSTSMGGVNLTSTNWTTITFSLAPTEGELTGIIIQNGNGGFQGPIIYYLDNLVFTKPTSAPTAPTLAIAENPSPGLKLYASAPGQAYQRQNVVYLPSEDPANQLWWINQPGPLTYSVTWADFPDRTSAAGFQGHIMLATDSSRDTAPDWTDANVVMVEFQYVNTEGPDGTIDTEDDEILAQARLLHKVNEPAANGMLYRTQANAEAGPVGVLGQLRAPSMLGTWSIAFHDNNRITLTGPDDSTVDFTMPDADAPFYEPATTGVSALFGVQPNADTRIGMSAGISRIKIVKGSEVVVDETFQTPELNSDLWAIRAQDAGGIFTTTPDAAFLISWNLPDTGFSLQAAPAVKGPWSQATEPRLVGARRVTVLDTSALPDPKAGFFRLAK